MDASDTAIRDVAEQDLAWVLALNTVHEQALSPLTPTTLSEMIAMAYAARAVGNRDAFLIAFDQDADYHSPNFHWFRERFDRFIYVDRIAVDAAARGRGLARVLYDDLFDRARAQNHSRVVCEVNSDPPNPASDAFHAKLGFGVVGEAHLEVRDKTVRYLERAL